MCFDGSSHHEQSQAATHSSNRQLFSFHASSKMLSRVASLSFFFILTVPILAIALPVEVTEIKDVLAVKPPLPSAATASVSIYGLLSFLFAVPYGENCRFQSLGQSYPPWDRRLRDSSVVCFHLWTPPALMSRGAFLPQEGCQFQSRSLLNRSTS